MDGWNPVVVTMVVAGAALALAVVAFLAFVYYRAHLLLTPRRRPYDVTPDAFGLDAEDVRFRGPRGMLAGWFVPSRNGRTLICCHGINDNAAQWLPQIARLHREHGYGALLFDFAGHGRSEGSMVTYGARERLDVAAALEYLRARGDVNMAGIGILGYSLGAITAVLAAAERAELRAVVIESGFADLLRDVSKLFTRFTGLPAFPFANLIVWFGERISGARLAEIRPVRVIGRISPRPVLIISDLADALADEPYDGEHLYAAAGEPKELWQVPNAAHVNAYGTFPEEWLARVSGFLNTYLASTVSGEAVTGRDDAL